MLKIASIRARRIPPRGRPYESLHRATELWITSVRQGGRGAQDDLLRRLNRKRVEHAQVRVREDVAVRQRRPIVIRRAEADRDVSWGWQGNGVAPVAHIIINAVAF